MVWRFIIIEKSNAFFGVASVAIHAACMWLLLTCTGQGAMKKSPPQKLSLMAFYKKSEPVPFIGQTNQQEHEKILPKKRPFQQSGVRRAQASLGDAQAQNPGQDEIDNVGQVHDASVLSSNNDVRAYPQLINGQDIHVPYPERARQLMIEGVVRLRLTISEAGKVIHAEVISGPAFGLRHAALKVARKLFFLPATDEHGQARVEKVDHDVVFRLNRQS